MSTVVERIHRSLDALNARQPTELSARDWAKILADEDRIDSEFAQFQRIRLKYIEEMLGQLNQDSVAIHLLMVEKKAIEEFLGQ